MGTRSTYRVIETWKDEKTGKTKKNNLVLVYVQFDGYPSGHPSDTAEWLASGTVVNGIGVGEKKVVFNGAGCLAAQLISRLKGDGPGGTYVHAMNSRGKCWEDYTYDIIIDEDKTITFIAYDVRSRNDRTTFKKLFVGSPVDFADFVKKEKEEA